jgi:hypothetical protein
MKHVRVDNVTRGTLLGAEVAVADRFWSRFRGLLFRPPLTDGGGLLLDPCRAVHMAGMRQALDVAFLDPVGRVVATYPDLKPGGRTSWHRDARSALELPPGTLDRTGTAIGDALTCTPACKELV